VLRDELLAVVKAGQILGPDPGAFERALVEAPSRDVQAEADYLAAKSTKADWAPAVFPAPRPTRSPEWLHWTVPASEKGAGSQLGAFVESSQWQDGSVSVWALCFMGTTPMARFVYTVTAEGGELSDMRTGSLMRNGRLDFPVLAWRGYSERPYSDESLDETFAWVFAAPVLLALCSANVGGLSVVEEILSRSGGDRALPDALRSCRASFATASETPCPTA
jgi:hypothetical protein